jgi:signal peptidase II (EC:3.4.23.36). Aspartic peptidase. MEROPS family A08
MSLFKKSVAFIVVLLILDQVLKIWIKTNMMLGESYHIFGDWFQIYFIENNGMAFGMELEGEWGKMLLSLFRIIAVFGIGWYLLDIC